LRHLLTWQMRWRTVDYRVTGKSFIPINTY
jgi:hypothetical protein